MSTLDTVQPADIRRALVLMAHHLDATDEGVIAVVEEANAAGRAAHMMVAVLRLWARTTPSLASPAGRAWMARTIAEAASMEDLS